MRYIVFAFIFFSCTSNKEKDPAIIIPAEPLDTIQSPAAVINAMPAIFESAFIKGTTHNIHKSTVNLYGVTIGKIKLPTGQLVACDPLHFDEYGIPFTLVFPTGEFPVQLSIAKLGEEEMIAFVRINFKEAPVVKWEMALQEGQAPLALGEDKIEGFAVDAGVGIFMDIATLKILTENKPSKFERDLFNAMEKHTRPSMKFTMYNLGDLNLAAFSTGMGDGRYASYIGYDSTGNPCRLVTDFGLFKWRK